jgi:hypothetical protein
VSVEPVPRREVVTRSGRRARRPLASVEAADQAALDSARVRSLMRGQLRSALLFLAALAVPTALLPLLFAATSSGGGSSGRVLAWVVLGFAGYPPMVALGWWYVRRAERHERDFARSPRAAE